MTVFRALGVDGVGWCSRCAVSRVWVSLYNGGMFIRILQFVIWRYLAEFHDNCILESW